VPEACAEFHVKLGAPSATLVNNCSGNGSSPVCTMVWNLTSTVLLGDQVLGRRQTGSRAGYFYRPTVLSAGARAGSDLPGGDLRPGGADHHLRDDDEGLDLANDAEFGLVAYAFTQNLTRAIRVAERLQTGMVAINQGIVSNPAAPFGGVKASGLGREGGAEGIDEYLETKYVGIKL
jgi:succinate-semialdehyde dehydrogenase / glutarate-semialdehyde dehydrogenase